MYHIFGIIVHILHELRERLLRRDPLELEQGVAEALPQRHGVHRVEADERVPTLVVLAVNVNVTCAIATLFVVLVHRPVNDAVVVVLVPSKVVWGDALCTRAVVTLADDLSKFNPLERTRNSS